VGRSVVASDAAMKWIAAGLVVVLGIAVAWSLWPHDEATHAPAAVTKAPKRIDRGKRPAAPAPATLAGSVRDPRGKPLAGANVCITQQRAHRCVRSGSDGRYAIDGVLAEAAKLGASLAKHEPQLIDVPAIETSEQRTIDVVLEPGGLEITGVVEDILGGPIAQAHVRVDGAHADCDDQGRFTLWVAERLEGLRDVRRVPGRGELVFVTATADGYGPHGQPVRAPGTITITLAPESSISGRVVDATTGAAIAGARVVSRDAAVTSGPDGAFAFTGLAAGDYTFAASAPGHYGGLDRTIAVGMGERVEGVELRVSPARTVVVTLDVQGDRAICAPAPALADWSFEVPPPWRDDAGRYHFDAVPPGTYSVTLGCGAEVPPLVVGDDDIEISWRVETGGVVKGIVRVEESSVLLAVDLGRIGAVRPPLRSEARDKTFEFRGVPAGRYKLWSTIDQSAMTPPETIEVVNGQTLEHDIVVPQREKFRLSGTVVDETGQPIARGTVGIMNTRRMETFTTTIANGRFEIRVPSDRYNVTARSGAASAGQSVVVDADAHIALTLAAILERSSHHGIPKKLDDERYTLWGRVVDAQRVPVSDAIVTANGSNLDVVENLRTTTDATGKFKLVSKFSQMKVHAYRIGGGDAEMLVRADQPVEIMIGARELITGTVARPGGGAPSRFLIRVGDPDPRTYTFDHTGGKFAIEDPHTYPLRLVAGVNDLEGEPVMLTPQSAKTNVVLPLPKTVTIRGRVIDSTTRAPIANVSIHGKPRREGWAPWFTHADQITDVDGYFTLREVPPGELMLEVFAPLDTWATQSFTVTVPDGGGAIEELSLARARR
jgi:protocatechuate 3,4-dioxygenase beta subunit